MPTLQYYGMGGGPSGKPTSDVTDDAYLDDYCKCIRDMCGAGAPVRIDITGTQISTTTGAYSWNPAKADRLMYYIAKHGLQALAVVKYRAALADQVPVYDHAANQLTQFKRFVREVVERYGPGGTFGNGSIADGHTVSGYTAVTLWELWNEPNSIGSGNKTMDTGGKWFASSPSQGLNIPYYINRDGAAAVRDVASAGGWESSAVIIGGAIGSIDMNYINTIFNYGPTLFGPNGCTAWSVHIYQHTLATTTDGGPRTLNTLDALRTSLNSHGGSNTFMWITEGIYAGQHRWNRYRLSYNNYTATGSHVTRDIVWESSGDFGYSAGELDQAQAFTGFLNRIKTMNSVTDTTKRWKVQGITPHVMFDEEPTYAAAGDSYYWMNARGLSRRPGGTYSSSTGFKSAGNYTPASGSPFRSPDWKGAGIAYYEWINGHTADTVPADPFIISGPTDGGFSGSTATFTWGDEDGGVTFEVRIDGGSWLDMGFTTTKTYGGLSDGSHTFDVRAVNNVGTSGITSRTWTADGSLTNTSTPVVSIVSPNNGGSVVLPFAVEVSATDPDGIALVEVSLDGGATWEVATALDNGNWSLTVDVLTTGEHTLYARATDAATLELTGVSSSIIVFVFGDVPDVVVPPVFFDDAPGVSPVNWTVNLYTRGGAFLATLHEAYDRRLHFELNGIDSCDFTVPLDSENAASIEPLKTVVKVWRRIADDKYNMNYIDAPDRPVFAGVVGPIQYDAAGGSMQVTVYSPFWKLQHRYQPDAHTHLQQDPSRIMLNFIRLTGTALFENTDADVIGLLNPLTALWPLGGSWAVYTPPLLINVTTPRGQNTWAAIEDIIMSDGRPDLVPLYCHYEDHYSLAFFNTAIVRGVRPDDATVRFEYRTGLNNLDNMAQQTIVEPGKFANIIIAQGQGDSNSRKVEYPKLADTASWSIVEEYGVYMKWLKFDKVKSREDLRAKAIAELKRSQLPVQVYQPSLSPTMPPYFKMHFDVGDVVKVSCDRGAMQFTEIEQRIYQVDLEMTNNNFEICTLAMAPDFTSAVPA